MIPQGKMTGAELEAYGYCMVMADITKTEMPFFSWISGKTYNYSGALESEPGKPNKCLKMESHPYFGRVARIEDVMKAGAVPYVSQMEENVRKYMAENTKQEEDDRRI